MLSWTLIHTTHSMLCRDAPVPAWVTYLTAVFPEVLTLNCTAASCSCKIVFLQMWTHWSVKKQCYYNLILNAFLYVAVPLWTIWTPTVMKKLAEPVVELAFFVVLYATPSPTHTNEGDSSLVLRGEIPVHLFSNFLLFWGEIFLLFFFPMWNPLCWTWGVAGCHVLWHCLRVTRHGLSLTHTDPSGTLSQAVWVVVVMLECRSALNSIFSDTACVRCINTAFIFYRLWNF